MLFPKNKAHYPLCNFSTVGVLKMLKNLLGQNFNVVTVKQCKPQHIDIFSRFTLRKTHHNDLHNSKIKQRVFNIFHGVFHNALYKP